MSSPESYVFPPRKAEIANSITHGLGFLFSLGVIVVMFFSPSVPSGNRISLLIFGCCMAEMYGVSTVYHAMKSLPRKRLLRLFDHISIYFLIAGTYTPFILLCLHGVQKWLFLSVVWGIVLLGIVYKLVWWRKYPRLSLYIYLAMGWMVVFFIKPVYTTLPANGFVWLIAGGLFYSAGTFFYANRRPVYNHAVWHLFVLGGSICHFLSVMSIG
jgi:hemolysin III